MNNTRQKESEDRWTKAASKLLVGRTIVSVRYTTDEELEVVPVI